MNNNIISSNLKTPSNVNNTNISNDQDQRPSTALLFNTQEQSCSCQKCKIKSFLNLDSSKGNSLDLASLMEKGYSDNQMLEMAKEISGGIIPCNKMNSIGEFLIMRMYQLLNKLELASASIEINLIKNKTLKNTEERPIKNHIYECKTTLLELLVELQEILKNKKQPSAQNIKQFYDNLKEHSQKFLSLLNQSSHFPTDAMKKYIKFLNFFETIYKNEENSTAFLPWLYQPTATSMQASLNYSCIESVHVIFEQLQSGKKFAVQTASYYLASLKNITCSIQEKLKHKKFESLKSQSLCLNQLISTLEKRLSLIEAIDPFLSEGKYGKKILVFSQSSQHPYLGFFDMKMHEEMKRDLEKEWRPELTKLTNALIDQQEITELYIQSERFGNLLKKTLIQEASELLKLIQKMDMYNSSALRLPILLLGNLFTLTSTDLNCIQFSHHFAQKIESEKNIVFNNTYTLLSPILKTIRGFKLMENDTTSLRYKLLRQIENSLMYCIIISTQEPNRILPLSDKFTTTLTLLVNILKQAFSCYQKENNESIALTFKQIHNQIQGYQFFIQKHRQAPLFFIQRKKTLHLNKKEFFELKNHLFPESIKEIQNSPLKIILNDTEKSFNILLENPSSSLISILHGFMRLHLTYWVKVESLVQTLYDFLKENWKLTSDNLNPIHNALIHLQFIKEKLPQTSDFKIDKSVTSYLDEQESEIVKNLEYRRRKSTASLYFFLFITLPMTKQWFNAAKTEFKKQIEITKKKKNSTSNQKNIDLSKNPPLLKSKNISPISLFSTNQKENIEKKPQEPIETTSVEIVENRENLSEKNVLEKKTDDHLKKQHRFKTIHHTKKLHQTKPLSCWEEMINHIESLYRQFLIFELTSGLEGYWNLFQRFQEFEKSQLHIHYHIWTLNQASSLGTEKIPKIFSRVSQQSWALITESSIKAVLLTKPICAETNNKIHLLWEKDENNRLLINSHDGVKLFSYLDKTLPKEKYPIEIKEMRGQLCHTYLGKMPKIFQTDDKVFSIRTRLLLQKAINEQGSIKTTTVSKHNIEMMRHHAINILNHSFYWTTPNKNISLEPFTIHKETILNWVGNIQQTQDTVLYAKERIYYAFELYEELLFDEIKDKPTLYCSKIADINTLLMSNFIHLYLAEKDELDEKEKIENRPLTHCHHPLKLWNLMVKKSLVKENEKRARCMERYSTDFRYPYGMSSSVAQELAQIFEIDTALSSPKLLKKNSPRIQKLVEKHWEKGFEDLSSLILNFEIDAAQCLEVIAEMISDAEEAKTK